MSEPPQASRAVHERVRAADVPADLLLVADEAQIREELAAWRARILRPPRPWDTAARSVQQRINRAVPERLHAVITSGVEAMTRGILSGSGVLRAQPPAGGSLAARERKVRTLIRTYRNTAGAEGGIAGAGGFVLAAADFPALLAIKVRMLADIVSVYGWGEDSAQERLFLLHIFHLAFSSPERRPEALKALEAWLEGGDPCRQVGDYDWRRFQQEYRDHIDLAKLAQLIPVVGAPIGAVVNWRLVDRLAETAMMGCRMRWFQETAP